MLNNKYKKWYNNICHNAQTRGWTKNTSPCYVECHHIIPKSLNGNNDKNNLVCLTAKEHFICHWLLCYCYDGKNKIKCAQAFRRMSSPSKKHSYTKHCISARYFDISRQILSESMKGKNNPYYGMVKEKHHLYGVGHSAATKEKMSKTRKGVFYPNIRKYDKDSTRNKKIANSLEQKYRVVDPNGIGTNISNLKKFCKENNLTETHMYACAQGKIQFHKGWKCSKINQE